MIMCNKRKKKSKSNLNVLVKKLFYPIAFPFKANMLNLIT